MDKTVTIAIASYNNASVIERCVESVINQTYKRLEVLIVDDGSKDDTLSRLEKYNNDSRIRIISKENGGLSSVRQTGMDEATGEYICFIDADDYLMPSYVEALLNKIRIDRSDICVCSTRFEDQDGKYDIVSSNIFRCKSSISPIILSPVNVSDLNDCHVAQMHLSDSWNKMYKLSSIKETEVKFHMKKGLNGSDMLFNMQIALHSLSYSTISEECYVHVMYSHSAVHRKNRDLNQTFKTIVEGILDESKIIEAPVDMIESMSVRWYLWQEAILRDIYDSSSFCCQPHVYSLFMNVKKDQIAFVKKNKLNKCNLNYAKSTSEKCFLFLYKHFFYMIPLLFLFKDYLHVIKRYCPLK